MINKSTFVTTTLLLLSTFGAGICAHAQAPILNYASASAAIKPATISAGGHANIVVSMAVIPGFHINSATPNDPDLIPTVVSASGGSGLIFGAAVYPRAKVISAPSLSQKPLFVYTGHVLVDVPVTVSSKVKPGVYKINVSVSYQGCNSNSCYPPTTKTVDASLRVN